MVAIKLCHMYALMMITQAFAFQKCGHNYQTEIRTWMAQHGRKRSGAIRPWKHSRAP